MNFLDTSPAHRNRESALPAAGAQLLDRLPNLNIELLPLCKDVSIADLRRRFPAGPVVACDFYVTDIHGGERVIGGFEREGVLNIDHHADVAEMARWISSGNLAIERVQAFGPLHPDVPLVIHHTDCDSVVSSLIMRGHIPPHAAFGAAVIAADHSGEENAIADLLQALEKKRDLSFSARNLGLLLAGKSLEPEAQALLDARARERDIARDLVTGGNFFRIGGLSVLQPERKMSGEFFPTLLPDAKLIMLARALDDGKYEVNLRLGQAARPGSCIPIDRINRELDPNYGGRWNAGSNKRGGFTSIPPRSYASRLTLLIDWLS